MEIAGLCSICGKPIASFSCRLCGKIVCRNCFDQKNGICMKCNFK